MGLASGHKNTELGLLPNDWCVSKLGTCATFKTGPFGSALHKSDYVVGGVPIVNPLHICDGKIVPTARMTVPESIAKRLSDFRLSSGDIVIGRRGEMGRCAVVGDREDGWLCGTGSMIVRASSSVDAAFLQLILASPKVVAAIENGAVGTTMINLNQGTLSNLDVPIPPTKAEQEAIAEALSDADALIESIEELVKKKRLIKQGAMQELLTGKKRLPGFESEPGTKQTEVGEIPVDWDVTTVGAQFSVQLGKMLDAEKNTGVERPYLGNRAVQWGQIDLEDVGTVKLTPADLNRYRLRAGDLLVCEGGEVGRAAIWQAPISECYYQKALHRLRPTDGYNVALMLNLIQLRAMAGGLRNYVTQTSIAHLPKEKFVTVPLPLPSSKEQRAIADVLADMELELEALDTKLTKVRQVKQGMMHELLTGRIRLV